MVLTTAFVSMPAFIMGSLLLVLFAIKLGWLPANASAALTGMALCACDSLRRKLKAQREWVTAIA